MPGVTCLYGRVLRYEEKRAGRTWKIASHHTHLSAQKNLIKHCCCCLWAPNLCETHIANGVASPPPPPVVTDAAADVVEVTVEVEGNSVSRGRESPPPPPPGEDEEGDPGPGPKGPELSNLAKRIENAGMKYLQYMFRDFAQ